MQWVSTCKIQASYCFLSDNDVLVTERREEEGGREGGGGGREWDRREKARREGDGRRRGEGSRGKRQGGEER